jgi:hypothetical protein
VGLVQVKGELDRTVSSSSSYVWIRVYICQKKNEIYACADMDMMNALLGGGITAPLT